MQKHTIALCGVSALALLSGVQAHAQTASGAGQASDASEVKLEEVIVTAQRREESAVKVPISISVVGGEKLAAKSVSDLQSVALNIPNFQITQTATTTQIFIRGVGTGNDPAFEQSVAQYVDGVSYGRAQLTRAPFFDIQRVEVLRGPQSILFGKNSTAGAVSLITAGPTEALRAGVTATYTPTFDQTEVTGYVSGPVAEGLGVRIAGRVMDDGGYVKNLYSGKDEPRRKDRAIRGVVTYDKIENFRATLKAEYQRFDMTGRDVEVVSDVATRTIPAGPSAGQPLTYAAGLALQGLPNVLTDTKFDRKRATDQPDYDNTNFYSGAFTTETDIGSTTLTTVSGLVDYTRSSAADLDFTTANILAAVMRENYRQFSQEVRIATAAEKPLALLAGLYFERNELQYSDITGFGPDIAKLGFSPIANTGAVRTFRQNGHSFSGFGQLTWRVTDDLRVVGGLRLTQDDKNATRRIIARNGQLDWEGAPVTSAAALGIYASALGFALDNPGAPGHNLARQRSKFHKVPSIAVEYDATEDVMLFASYKEGYKDGGFDARGNSTGFGFEDETVQAYEAGFRAQLFDKRGSIGATVYRDDYSNLQVSQFDGRVGFTVGNAGSTRAQGVEVDGRYAIARGVTLSSSVSYLDFKYLDFKRGNCAFGETPDGDTVNGVHLCDYTGRRGRFTPKWNLQGSLSVDRPITEALNLRGSVDVSYKSSHQIHENLDPLGQISGYTLVDARLGVGTERWDVAVVGKNLLNERYATFQANVPFASILGANTQYAQTARPRSIAVQLSLRY